MDIQNVPVEWKMQLSFKGNPELLQHNKSFFAALQSAIVVKKLSLHT